LVKNLITILLFFMQQQYDTLLTSVQRRSLLAFNCNIHEIIMTMGNAKYYFPFQNHNLSLVNFVKELFHVHFHYIIHISLKALFTAASTMKIAKRHSQIKLYCYCYDETKIKCTKLYKSISIIFQSFKFLLFLLYFFFSF
jgi:hypothetical protein